MAHSPALVLVDDRAVRRSAVRRGLPSALVGVVIGAISFTPFVLPLLVR